MLSTMVCHWSNYWQLLDYEILEYSLSSVNYVICQMYVCVCVFEWPEILLNINIYLRALSIYIEIYMWLSKETITSIGITILLGIYGIDIRAIYEIERVCTKCKCEVKPGTVWTELSTQCTQGLRLRD